MKSTKPFIVEVRGRRRTANQPKKSIWAGVNIQEMMQADAALAKQGGSEEPIKAVTSPDKNVEALKTISTTPDKPLTPINMIMEPPTEPVIKQETETPEPISSRVQPEDAQIARSMMRRRVLVELPAGQKWKRRLPKCLRTRK